jgi:hypothetical protein
LLRFNVKKEANEFLEAVVDANQDLDGASIFMENVKNKKKVVTKKKK